MPRQLEQPQYPNDGEELEDVSFFQVGGHLLKHQVNVKAQSGHVIDDIYAEIEIKTFD